MPGGAKKAVFPTMALHDHEQIREAAAEHRKHHHLVRGKSTDGGKESPEKEKDPHAKHKGGKNPPMTKSLSGHSTDGHHHHHHHGEGQHHHHHHQEQQQQQSHHHHHHEHHSHGGQQEKQHQEKQQHSGGKQHPEPHAAK
ncbi:Hypothetical predicted protein [Cloeon dipterum]|uniref:Uncharacterized protein n=1 Tax=Cloeon dipterum TaxID=197152 RepID=A0A8S1D4K1_9INSE|nr:Hypothetical predicted protein [Cloeon dipterum]